VQAQNLASAEELLGFLDAAHTHVFLLCWGGDCSSAQSGHPSLRAALSVQDQSWSVGRNSLYQLLLDTELENGYLYDFVAHWDEDGRLLGYCDTPPSWELINATLDPTEFDIRGEAAFMSAAVQGPSCYRWYEAFMALVQPALSGPIMVPDFACQDGSQKSWTAEYTHDGFINFFHRRALDLAMPYDLWFERNGWIGSQAVNIKKLVATYGDMISATLVRAFNPVHREYTKGFQHGQPCDLAQSYTEPAEIVPPSLRTFVQRRECQPCPLPYTGAGEQGHDFGTLNWVDRVWRRKEHYAELAATVGPLGF